MAPRLILVFATDQTGLFGLDGTIPWKCPEDMKHFNRITSDTFSEPILVMGRKTFESLPKKLEGRKHIVLSSKPVTNADATYQTLEQVLNNTNELLYIIGGASILEEVYTKYYALIHTIYYTSIHTVIENTANSSAVFMNPMILNHIKTNPLTQGKETTTATFYKLSPTHHQEFQYLDLLQSTITQGNYRKTRNACTYSMFNKTISFDLQKGFPLLTTKKVFLRGIFEELLFFIKGQTDSKVLESKGVNIWKPNTTKEFIDSCKLPYEEGDMGPMYGWNWRHFGANYKDCTTDYTGQGYDQLEDVLSLLVNDPHSRRILMTTYNPSIAKQGVLYPCHSIVLQFYVKDNNGKYMVSLNMYQRSVDLACGLPFNIASNALLLHMICATLNKALPADMYYPKTLNIILGDIHVYEQHVENVKEQIQRIPFTFPSINFKNTYTKMEDYKWEDIELHNYQCHPAIKYEMVA